MSDSEIGLDSFMLTKQRMQLNVECYDFIQFEFPSLLHVYRHESICEVEQTVLFLTSQEAHFCEAAKRRNYCSFK